MYDKNIQKQRVLLKFNTKNNDYNYTTRNDQKLHIINWDIDFFPLNLNNQKIQTVEKFWSTIDNITRQLSPLTNYTLKKEII